MMGAVNEVRVVPGSASQRGARGIRSCRENLEGKVEERVYVR